MMHHVNFKLFEKLIFYDSFMFMDNLEDYSFYQYIAYRNMCNQKITLIIGYYLYLCFYNIFLNMKF